MYKAALKEREGCFDKVIFAIFDAGYPPDNFKPFCKVFGDESVTTMDMDSHATRRTRSKPRP